uniref:Secreted protein n=1 Tax=Cacopsylla melanoneura TaxID=428564 RepID=A0A8D8QGM3_9HEMI
MFTKTSITLSVTFLLAYLYPTDAYDFKKKGDQIVLNEQGPVCPGNADKRCDYDSIANIINATDVIIDQANCAHNVKKDPTLPENFCSAMGVAMGNLNFECTLFSNPGNKTVILRCNKV